MHDRRIILCANNSSNSQFEMYLKSGQMASFPEVIEKIWRTYTNHQLIFNDRVQGSNDQHNIACRLRWKDIGKKLEEEGLQFAKLRLHLSHRSDFQNTAPALALDKNIDHDLIVRLTTFGKLTETLAVCCYLSPPWYSGYSSSVAVD